MLSDECANTLYASVYVKVGSTAGRSGNVPLPCIIRMYGSYEKKSDFAGPPCTDIVMSRAPQLFDNDNGNDDAQRRVQSRGR